MFLVVEQAVSPPTVALLETFELRGVVNSGIGGSGIAAKSSMILSKVPPRFFFKLEEEGSEVLDDFEDGEWTEE